MHHFSIGLNRFPQVMRNFTSSIINFVYELPQELPIKTWDLWKLGNIKKMSNLVAGRDQHSVSLPKLRFWPQQLRTTQKPIFKFLDPVQFCLIPLLWPIDFFQNCS